VALDGDVDVDIRGGLKRRERVDMSEGNESVL
jgi:hypothetical protein